MEQIKFDDDVIDSNVFVIKKRDGKYYSFGHQTLADKTKFQIVLILPSKFELPNDKIQPILFEWEKNSPQKIEILNKNEIPVLVQFVNRELIPVEYQILPFSKMIRDRTLMRHFSYQAFTFFSLLPISEDEYWDGFKN